MSRVPSVGYSSPAARPVTTRPPVIPQYRYDAVPGAPQHQYGATPAPAGTPGGLGAGLPNWHPQQAAQQAQGGVPKWQPGEIPSARPVDVGSALGGYGYDQGASTGGYLVAQHNPQPAYWNYAANQGIGFQGGTGWAGTGVNRGTNAPVSGWAGDSVQEQRSYDGGQAQGGVPSTPLGNVAQEWQRAYDEAKAANESRYKDILGGYGNRLDRTLSRLNGMGDQQKVDLREQYNNNASRINSSLVDRGMTNTTVKDNLLQGNERERVMAQNRLQEALNREYIGYDTGLEQDRLQFMERRQDSYPDLGQLLQLAQLMGAGGNGANNAGMLAAMAGAGGGGGGGFVAPGNFGMGGGGPGFMNGGGGGGGGGGLSPYQQMLAQQNYQNKLNNAVNSYVGGGVAGYNQRWAAGSADRSAQALDPYGVQAMILGDR